MEKARQVCNPANRLRLLICFQPYCESGAGSCRRGKRNCSAVGVDDRSRNVEKFGDHSFDRTEAARSALESRRAALSAPLKGGLPRLLQHRLLECKPVFGQKPGAPPRSASCAPRCPFIGYVPRENDVAWMRCCAWTQGSRRPIGRPSFHPKELSCNPMSCKPKQFNRS